jgi:hypothetical protein
MLRLLGVLKRLEASGRHLLGLNRCASQQIASLDFPMWVIRDRAISCQC